MLNFEQCGKYRKRQFLIRTLRERKTDPSKKIESIQLLDNVPQ